MFGPLLLKHGLCRYCALAPAGEHGRAKSRLEAQISCCDPCPRRLHLLVKQHRDWECVLLLGLTLIELKQGLRQLLQSFRFHLY